MQIEVRDLTYVYSAGMPFQTTALEGVSFDVEEGEFCAVIGHTGSGKTTLVQLIAGLLKPDSGSVSADKARIGIVFQYPEYQLFEETVYKDIAFGPTNMKLSAEEIDERVREAAEFADVDEELFDRSPLELSGGQKRRIAIAGVIAMRPEVLILDEPTAGLDPAGCSRILENIRRYREATGNTVIIISHSMDDVASYAERIIVFCDGRVAMDGTPEEIFSRAEELMAIGLSVPKSTEIAVELRRRGVVLPDSIYSHEQLLSAILALKEGKPC